MARINDAQRDRRSPTALSEAGENSWNARVAELDDVEDELCPFGPGLWMSCGTRQCTQLINVAVM